MDSVPLKTMFHQKTIFTKFLCDLSAFHTISAGCVCSGKV